ncbi:hypothetical protein KCU95_g2889, partial [Aureobasidium melanogenum]
MADQDNTILGLRTQILENWAFLQLGEDKMVILVERKNSHYEAVFAQIVCHTEVLKVSDRHLHIEDALREVLDWTCEKTSESFDSRREVRHATHQPRQEDQISKNEFHTDS